jgi:hypothetical protein
MINLTSTSDKVQVVTGSAVTIDVHASWVDNASGVITPGRTNSAITTATTTDIVPAPAASTQRNVKTISIRNKHATLQCVVTVKHTDGTTAAEIISTTLLPNEELIYTDSDGWTHMQNTVPVSPFINGFRLTGVTLTPVMTADSTSLSTVYLTPYTGAQIALYDGANWQLVKSAEISLAVTGRTTDLPFDVFCVLSGGNPALEFLDWTNSTTRATGLTRQDGVWTKTGDATRRYLGSVRARSATTYHWVMGGTDLPCKFDLFNNDNRFEFKYTLKAVSPATWTYTTATIRQAQASANYQVDVMVGLQEEFFEGLLQVASTNSTISILRSVGIGFDSTTTFTGVNVPSSNTVASIQIVCEARISHQPTIGRHIYSWNETSVATGTNTFTGTSATAGANTQSGMTGLWRC